VDSSPVRAFNKSVALETDQIDTASLRHRRPRIFAALLAGIGLVLIVGGSRLLMLGGSLYYLVAGLAWVLSGALLWRGRRLGGNPDYFGEGAQTTVGAEAHTPVANMLGPFLSPLGTPCQRPPWGYLSAVDLTTHRLVWSHPLGTARDVGPFGIPTMLPIEIGTPSMGGPLTTRGGLTFIGAAQDRYFRAYDSSTGKRLWQARLPAGGNATPMTYTSPAGRQFVVLAVGGSSIFQTKRGDYIIAYALPKSP